MCTLLATTQTAVPVPALTVRSLNQPTRNAFRALPRLASSSEITHQLIFIVNPFTKKHGGPTDSERHVGDLGNVKTDGQGNAKGSIQDKLVKLIGPESVVGVSDQAFIFMRGSF